MKKGVFSRHDIRDHFRAPKAINEITFRQAGGRSQSSAPFLRRIRGRRVHHTDVMDCGGAYRALFVWRDGEIREKRSFYAWLFIAKGEKDLIPLARIDYHPSHKDLHILVNCEDSRDLTNRALPGSRELTLTPLRALDPAEELDRQTLIRRAMEIFGIEFATPDGGLL